MRRVRGSDVGMKAAWVTPRFKVMPMGWSWALWWCQGIHERCVEAAGLGKEARIQDGRVTDSSRVSHFQYVDNFGAIGDDEAKVRTELRAVVGELRRRGLPGGR